MARQQEEVVGIDQAFLGVGAEEVLRVADDELVQGRARRDENSDRTRPPPRSTELLPGRRDRARVSDEHRRLKASDVDAELEGVRADDPCDLTAAQTGLDFAPVQRQVAGTIAPHTLMGVETWGEVLPQIAEHHLDLEPASAEDDRLTTGADPRRGDAACFEHRAAPDAHLAVD